VDQIITQAIRDIIALEATNDPSWDARIADISLATIRYLDENLMEIDERIDHYLHDFDIRRKDQKYAIWQTSEVIEALGD